MLSLASPRIARDCDVRFNHWVSLGYAKLQARSSPQKAGALLRLQFRTCFGGCFVSVWVDHSECGFPTLGKCRGAALRGKAALWAVNGPAMSCSRGSKSPSLTSLIAVSEHHALSLQKAQGRRVLALQLHCLFLTAWLFSLSFSSGKLTLACTFKQIINLSLNKALLTTVFSSIPWKELLFHYDAGRVKGSLFSALKTP